MSDNAGMFISPVPRTIILTNGYTFKFNNDENGEPIPVYVAPPARQMLLQHGCLPVDGDFESVAGKPKDNTPEPDPIGEERSKRIKEVLQEMVIENNPDDFSGGGVPKVARLQKRLGFVIAAKERDNYWMETLSKKAN